MNEQIKQENLNEGVENTKKEEATEPENKTKESKDLADILTGKVKIAPKEYATNLINSEINKIPSGNEFSEEQIAGFIRATQSRMEQESKIFLDKALQEKWTEEQTNQKASEILSSMEDIARKMIYEEVKKSEQVSKLDNVESLKQEIDNSQNVEMLAKLELSDVERQQVISNLIEQQLGLAKSNKVFKEEVLGFNGDTLPYLSDSEKTKIIGLLDATALKSKMNELKRQAETPMMTDKDIQTKALEILEGSKDFGKGMKELVSNKIRDVVLIRQTPTIETPTVGNQPTVKTEIKGPTPIKEGAWGKIKGFFGRLNSQVFNAPLYK